MVKKIENENMCMHTIQELHGKPLKSATVLGNAILQPRSDPNSIMELHQKRATYWSSAFYRARSDSHMYKFSWELLEKIVRSTQRDLYMCSTIFGKFSGARLFYKHHYQSTRQGWALWQGLGDLCYLLPTQNNVRMNATKSIFSKRGKRERLWGKWKVHWSHVVDYSNSRS